MLGARPPQSLEWGAIEKTYFSSFHFLFLQQQFSQMVLSFLRDTVLFSFSDHYLNIVIVNKRLGSPCLPRAVLLTGTYFFNTLASNFLLRTISAGFADCWPHVVKSSTSGCHMLRGDPPSMHKQVEEGWLASSNSTLLADAIKIDTSLIDLYQCCFAGC